MSSNILYFKKTNNAAPDETQNSLYTHISIIFTDSKHTNNSLQDSKPWYSILLNHPFSLYLFHYQQHWYSHLTSSLQLSLGHSVTLFHPAWTSMLFLQLLFHHRKNKVWAHHSKACSYLPSLVRLHISLSLRLMQHITYSSLYPFMYYDQFSKFSLRLFSTCTLLN